MDGGVRAQEAASGELAECEERLVAPGSVCFDGEGHEGVGDRRGGVAVLDGLAVLAELSVGAAGCCVEWLLTGVVSVRRCGGVDGGEVEVGARGGG